MRQGQEVDNMWKQMDVDKDEKVSLSEWLSGTEAIANLAGEEKFLTALLEWGNQEESLPFSHTGARSKKLQTMIKSEMARKKAEGEPFEAADHSAKLKPPFSVTKELEAKAAPVSGRLGRPGR